MSVPSEAKKPEQRHWPRARFCCFVRTRPSQPTPDEFDHVHVTANCCRNGFYFTTDQAIFRKHLRLFVMLPYSNAANALNREYVGEVLRVDRLAEGRLGVAVTLITTIGMMSNPAPKPPASKPSPEPEQPRRITPWPRSNYF